VILLNWGVSLKSGILDSRGKLVDSNGVVSIFEGFPNFFYDVNRPELSSVDRKLADALSEAITGKIALFSLEQIIGHVPSKFMDAFTRRVIADINLASGMEKIPSTPELESFAVAMGAVIAEFFPDVKNPGPVAKSAIDNSIGFGSLSDLVSDPGLEEIMVNGLERPVFVFHRKFGMCKTNIVFDSPKALDSLVLRIARTAAKPFDESFPLLDARLPDGSRVNATNASVSPEGVSLTIRKFSRANYSVVDLILHGTLSSELAAFLWVMVEGLGVQPMNLIVTGGTGSGKTTTLNCLAAFVPAYQRIVSIEDTLELDLVHRQNWVQLESRPRSRATDAVSMDELLQNALRMRPDRLLVGEVRDEGAQTLFVAMDTGHDGTMGTVHANSAKELLLRLRSKPMNVPESMLGLLDLIIVQHRLFLPGKGLVRRIVQVSELSSMEEKPLLSMLFEWNRKTDLLSRTETPSHVLQVLSERSSHGLTDIRKEIAVRRQVLEWMVERRIVSHDEVSAVVQRYYSDPQGVIAEILKSRD